MKKNQVVKMIDASKFAKVTKAEMHQVKGGKRTDSGTSNGDGGGADGTRY